MPCLITSSRVVAAQAGSQTGVLPVGTHFMAVQVSSAAQSAASVSRSHISPRNRPMCGMQTWCSGWNASSNSFGRTSNPHVSVAIPAISVPYSQSAVVNDSPGEGPPA